MPTIVIPEMPRKAPVLDANGYISTAWAAWMYQVFLRLGGNIALSNEDIESIFGDDIAALQAGMSQLESDVSALQTAEEITQGPVL
jgi:hypothetical protein